MDLTADSKMVTRLVLALLVGLFVAGCAADGSVPVIGRDPGETDTAPTPVGSEPRVERPDTWIGVQGTGDDFVFVRDGTVTVGVAQASVPLDPPDSPIRLIVTDIDAAEPAIFTLCCEPLPGSGHRVDGGRFGLQADRVDRRAGTLIRSDRAGTLGIRGPDEELEGFILEFAGIADVALLDGRGVALQAPHRVSAQPGDAPPGTGLVTVPLDGGDTTRVELAGDACGIARYGLHAVVVHRSDGQRCRRWFDVVDPDTGELLGSFDAGTPVVHFSADESGQWLIFTHEDGKVTWRGTDGSTGVLAEEGFLAADWS